MDKSEQAAGNGDQQEDPVEMDEEAAAKEKLTSDPNKVKFTSVNLDGFDGKNGEAKVDIYCALATVGMGKEELMKYANEPFWVRLRMFLFVFFWISWIAMLVGAVVIILLAPRCPPAPTLDWYQKTAIYQVDVETFKDSDDDGIGDIKGLISKLDYFKLHNIGTLMLNSFYETADDDTIVDHKKINPRLGTLTDFEELVSELKARDMKLIIDFNAEHTSDKHQWFQNAIKNKEPYLDYYIWKNSDGPGNNWINMTGDSVWRYINGKHWLCTSGFYKPHLNLRNQNVRLELAEVLNFWLEKGVHGFKVVGADHLFVDKYFRDEPLGTNNTVFLPSYNDLDHIYTINQPENFELFAEWREILNNFNESAGVRRILLAETSSSFNSSLLYYGNSSYTLADLPFNNKFFDFDGSFTAVQLKDRIEMWSLNSPANAWPSFLVGGKSTKRLSERFGDLLDGVHMISILARGTPIIYYGDELGIKSKMSKTAMLWSNDTNAGFSLGSVEFEVHPDFESINVEAQEKDKTSHLNIFKRLLALRDQPALGFGLQDYPVVTNKTFSMIRVRKGSPGYLVVVNLGTQPTVIDFEGKSKYLPEVARVEIRSRNLLSGPLTEGEHPKVSLKDIPLDAEQAVVFSFVPQFKD